MLHHTFIWPTIELPMAPKLISWVADCDILEFLGPATAHCFGHAYVTLTSGGIKDEGMPGPGPKVWTPEEAWDRYREQFNDFTKGHSQIAWRELPRVEQSPENGTWRVYSRLVAF